MNSVDFLTSYSDVRVGPEVITDAAFLLTRSVQHAVLIYCTSLYSCTFLCIHLKKVYSATQLSRLF